MKPLIAHSYPDPSNDAALGDAFACTRFTGVFRYCGWRSVGSIITVTFTISDISQLSEPLLNNPVGYEAEFLNGKASHRSYANDCVASKLQ